MKPDIDIETSWIDLIDPKLIPIVWTLIEYVKVKEVKKKEMDMVILQRVLNIFFNLTYAPFLLLFSLFYYCSLWTSTWGEDSFLLLLLLLLLQQWMDRRRLRNWRRNAGTWSRCWRTGNWKPYRWTKLLPNSHTWDLATPALVLSIMRLPQDDPSFLRSLLHF